MSASEAAAFAAAQTSAKAAAASLPLCGSALTVVNEGADKQAENVKATDNLRTEIKYILLLINSCEKLDDYIKSTRLNYEMLNTYICPPSILSDMVILKNNLIDQVTKLTINRELRTVIMTDLLNYNMDIIINNKKKRDEEITDEEKALIRESLESAQITPIMPIALKDESEPQECEMFSNQLATQLQNLQRLVYYKNFLTSTEFFYYDSDDYSRKRTIITFKNFLIKIMGIPEKTTFFRPFRQIDEATVIGSYLEGNLDFLLISDQFTSWKQQKYPDYSITNHILKQKMVLLYCVSFFLSFFVIEREMIESKQLNKKPYTKSDEIIKQLSSIETYIYNMTECEIREFIQTFTQKEVIDQKISMFETALGAASGGLTLDLSFRETTMNTRLKRLGQDISEKVKKTKLAQVVKKTSDEACAKVEVLTYLNDMVRNRDELHKSATYVNMLYQHILFQLMKIYALYKQDRTKLTKQLCPNISFELFEEISHS